MIDDKKNGRSCCGIYKLFKRYMWFYSIINASKEGFKAGAKWAINELLKDLVHPASEVPRNDYTDILIVCKEPQRPIVLNLEDILDESADDFASYNDMWMHLCDVYKITKYCYIGDLFPKKGGNHD